MYAGDEDLAADDDAFGPFDEQHPDQCECGEFFCTRDHDEDAAWAAHGREF